MGERESQALCEEWKPQVFPFASITSPWKKALEINRSVSAFTWNDGFLSACVPIFHHICLFPPSVCPPPDRSRAEYITSAFNIVLLSNWIESPTPTCSPVLTMDNMPVGLWQIKPARYMAITFTAKHWVEVCGGGCYKGRGAETERGMETCSDGWGDHSSRTRHFKPQFNVCTSTSTLNANKRV